MSPDFFTGAGTLLRHVDAEGVPKGTPQCPRIFSQARIFHRRVWNKIPRAAYNTCEPNIRGSHIWTPRLILSGKKEAPSCSYSRCLKTSRDRKSTRLNSS